MFHLAAQLTRNGGANGYSPYLNFYNGGMALATLDGASSANIWGIYDSVVEAFYFNVVAVNEAQYSGTASSSFTFDLQFYPANDNWIWAGLASGGDMLFTYIGSAGTNYVLERTFNLLPPIV